MTSIDNLLRGAGSAPKRKLEVSHDPSQYYKSAKHSANGDAKGRTHQATVQDEVDQERQANGPADGEDDNDDDIEAGPALPPADDEDEDEEGRFFGGGIDRTNAAALDYINERDAQDTANGTGGGGSTTNNPHREPDAYDPAWLRRLALSFERRISRNAELRARHESDPGKFMQSEADLDEEIKSLSILSEHPSLYPDFARIGSAASLVSLLAHENTDIAIGAVQVLSELTDEDVAVEQTQWDALVDAALDADLLSLLASNFSRLDEDQEADRDGLYNSFGVLENLASKTEVAGRIGAEAGVMGFLLRRMGERTAPVEQNTQYAAELLAILLQASPENATRLLSRAAAGEAGRTNGHAAEDGADAARVEPMEALLMCLAPYRRSADNTHDPTEQEYVSNLFDALTVLLDDPLSKGPFVAAEGVELMLIMLREGKLARPFALRVLDHACSGSSSGGGAGTSEGDDGGAMGVCERLVDAQGLKTLFGLFMKEGGKKLDRQGMEHVLGIFASLLANLPAAIAGADAGSTEAVAAVGAARIRLLAKFVEKGYEKIARLVDLRMGFAERVAKVERDHAASGPEGADDDDDEVGSRAYESLTKRLDAGLYALQTVDVVLAWLVAEDAGAKGAIVRLLGEKGTGLHVVAASLREQVRGIEESREDGTRYAEGRAGMLNALLEIVEESQ